MGDAQKSKTENNAKKESAYATKIRRAMYTVFAALAIPVLTEGIICAEEKARKKKFLLNDSFLRRGVAVELFYDFLAQDKSSESSASCWTQYNWNNSTNVKEYGVNSRVKASVGEFGAALTFDVNAKKNDGKRKGSHFDSDSNDSWNDTSAVKEVHPSVTLSLPFSFRDVDVAEFGAGMNYYLRTTESDSKSQGSSSGWTVNFEDGSSLKNVTNVYSSNLNTTREDSLLGWNVAVSWRVLIPLDFTYTRLSGKQHSHESYKWKEIYTGDFYDAQGEYQGPGGFISWGDEDNTLTPRDINIKNISLTMPLQFGEDGRTLVMPGYGYYSERMSADDDSLFTESVKERIFRIAIKYAMRKNVIFGAGYSYTMRTNEFESPCWNSTSKSDQGKFTVSTTLQF